MEYFLNTNHWSNLFAVPNAVVDNYIKLASGQAIKILLYILRNNNKNVSSTELSKSLNISTEDIDDAFTFWEEVGILSKSNQIIETEQSLPYENNKKETNTVEATEAIKISLEKEEKQKSFIQRSSANYNIKPSEISEKIEKSSDIKALFQLAEQLMNSMLTHTEHRSFLWMHEYLGIKVDVLLMLIDYCVSIEKTNPAYIEKIAIDWNENSIDTIEKAQNEITRMKKTQSFSHKVCNAFGLKRHPTPKQKELINSWISKGFSIDIIEYACEKTINSAKALNFAYVNGILENWYSEGLSTRQQIDNKFPKKSYSKNESSSSEQSYNINEFDKLAFTLSTNNSDNDE